MVIKTQGLTHIHLYVRDLDRSLAFYKSVFGLEERFRDGPKMVFLNTPGCNDTITLNEDASKAQQAGMDAGIAHFGFRRDAASDLESAISDVEAAGGKLKQRGEHQPGAPFAYVQDPDGYIIEL
jgi:catechol 2,3-dioxygenase-like lactoylglutathione lyase family enzyme